MPDSPYVPDHVAEIRRTLDRLTAPARRDDIDAAADRIGELAAMIAGGEYRPAYNGWPNRETWNAALWIDNDQGSSEYAREIVAEHVTDPEAGPYDDDPALDRRVRLRNAADALRDWWSEAGAAAVHKVGPVTVTTDDTDLPGPLSDAWGYALAVTDWYRIAEGIAEDMTTPAQDRAAVTVP